MAKRPTKLKKYILCCGANGRAIIIGDLPRKPTPGRPVEPRNARMVLYWHEDCGGLLGLGSRGPRGSTRITAAVPALGETVWQEWLECSPEAAEAIDQWPAC